MKFLLYLFCILIFFPSSCSAIEEVILNIDDNNAPEPKAEKIFDEDDKFTLYEKIQDIKAKEVKGNYDLIEYDLGGYSSDTYFRSFFPGTEFSGWVTLKPLGKTKGKYGKLNLGGGLTAGKNGTDYTVSGLYAGYEYKNFMANFEYAYADGYNGARTISSNKAEGFYTTAGYKITPRIQVLARYDQYTPDKDFSDDIRREYSAGVNYFIKGQALKLMLNYVFCQNDLFEDSHRVILGTQLML